METFNLREDCWDDSILSSEGLLRSAGITLWMNVISQSLHIQLLVVFYFIFRARMHVIPNQNPTSPRRHHDVKHMYENLKHTHDSSSESKSSLRANIIWNNFSKRWHGKKARPLENKFVTGDYFYLHRDLAAKRKANRQMPRQSELHLKAGLSLIENIHFQMPALNKCSQRSPWTRNAIQKPTPNAIRLAYEI